MTTKTCMLTGLVVLAVLASAALSHAGKPGEGIKVGRLLMHPYLGIEGTYDTNPALRRNDYEKENDIFLTESLGIGFLFPTRIINVAGSIYVRRRDYLQKDANDQGIPGRRVDDHTDFGHTLNFSAGDRFGKHITADVNYQMVSDDTYRPDSEYLLNQPTQTAYPLDERASRVKRGEYNASLALHDNLTDKVNGNVGWHLNGTHYDSGSLLDHNENAFHADVGYLVTDKSAMFLRGEYGLHDSEAFDGTSDSKTVHLGWRTRFTAKTSFNAGAGVEQFSPSGLPEKEFFSFNLGWGWNPTRKWGFGLNGGNSAEPSSYESNNWRVMTTLSAAGSYQLSQKIGCSFGVAYRRDKYEYAWQYIDKPGLPGRGVTFDSDNYYAVPDTNDPAADNEDVMAHVGLSYRPHRCFSISLNASQEVYDSNFDSEDFGQTRIGISGRATY